MKTLLTILLILFTLSASAQNAEKPSKKSDKPNESVNLAPAKVDSLLTMFRGEVSELQKRLEEYATAKTNIEQRLLYLAGVVDAFTAVRADTTLRAIRKD